MAQKYMKKFSTLYVIGEMWVETIADTTTYLLGWPKSRILIVLSTGENEEEQQELSFIVGRNANW